MVDSSDNDTDIALDESESKFQHIIDIPKKHKDLCIYRVPSNLRQLNPKAYTPQLVSIGPFHHRKPEFIAMEKQKERYYSEFQKRIKSDRPFGKFKDYIGEEDIQKCYADKIILRNNKFDKMIEFDAVFIMEFFLRLKDQHKEKDHYKDDYVLSNPWLKEGICLDLILLENQLPIHVLNELYTFLDEEEREYCTFLDLACKCGFFQPPNIETMVCKCFPSAKEYPEQENRCQHKPTNDAKHLLDLLRCFYIPIDLTPNSLEDSNYHISYNATKLRDSGISFKAVQGRYLLDIKFKNHCCLFWLFSFLTCFKSAKIAKACLELPKLIIDDGTECKFRNLIALEQCHHPGYLYICNYVSLIDGLIETKEDVDFLLGKKVIVNYLGGNRAVAKLVNSLCRELTIDSRCYEEKIKELNAHYDSCCNLTMMTLRSVYLKDLWRISSTIVGLAVLAFTFVNFFRATLK
ncbi:hypothetical protein O6P43_017311 [Quillaja saponaria]|uniref:Uncharacterized protein n=1 Tax=Quillaja saponaria TaxID=32244 RepID=A0AAD7LQ43_QUISA|nr:hypothetical protein O6P43_017311 [Quillaja saponaria]